MSYNFPIDIVYTWVDGDDPQWLEKRNHSAQKNTSEDPCNKTNACRYRDNNELLYSLRSVAKYAPWVNRIFVVTDNQEPPFINKDNVTIIDHKEIFPDHSYLPSFNSCAIELCLSQIDGLSEHFLSFNDDVFFGNYVSKNDFFDKSGSPIIWGVKEKRSMKTCLTISDDTSDLDAAVAHTRNAFMDKGYGFTPVKFRHTPKPLKKMLLRSMKEQFPKEYERTLNNKFRSRDDFIFPLAYCLFCLKTNASKMINIGGVSKLISLLKLDFKHVETDAGSRRYKKRLAAIRWLKPKTFCINDTEDTTEEDVLNTQIFLSSMFPEKCKYEKQSYVTRR